MKNTYTLKKTLKSELFFTLFFWRFWITSSYQEVLKRYRRSAIGPFWLTLSLAITIGMLSVIYSKLWKIDIEKYIPYLSIGLIFWTLISSIIVEGCSIFTNAENYIQNMNIPFPVYAMQCIAKNIFYFLHNILILPIIMLAFHFQIAPINILFSILGTMLFIITAIPLTLMLGSLNVRFRDLNPIITALVNIGFLVTPILWEVSSIPSRHAWIALYNPFYLFLTVTRDPLLNISPPILNWSIVLVISALSWIIGCFIFEKSRKNIAFWL